jgi:hypothetical protein
MVVPRDFGPKGAGIVKSFIDAAFVILALSLLAASASAQQASNPPFDFPLHTTPEPPDRPNNDRRSRLREDRVLKKGPLAPTENDRNLFSNFLRARNTGLVRLMPREVYNSETYHTKKRLNIRGGGAYYSFASLTHAYGYGNDLELDHNILSVGFAGADYGMLTNLGDRPLEDITLDDPRARFIAQYTPPKPEPAARSEFRRFQAGVTIDGALYQSRLPVQVGATYLLRSVVYRESDVLVALRAVRKDSDGSVIIAWKLLKKYPKPELARTKQAAN